MAGFFAEYFSTANFFTGGKIEKPVSFSVLRKLPVPLHAHSGFTDFAGK